jgi:hypothetical protein
MLEFALKEKKGTKWIEIPFPTTTIERIQKMKELENSRCALKVSEDDKVILFICGNQEDAIQLQEAKRDGALVFPNACCMSFESAYGMAQHCPSMFLSILKEFCTVKDAQEYAQKLGKDIRGWW